MNATVAIVAGIVLLGMIGGGVAAVDRAAYKRGKMAAEREQAQVMMAKNDEIADLNQRLAEVNQRLADAKPEIIKEVVSTIEYVTVDGPCPPPANLSPKTRAAIDKAGAR